MARMDNHWDIAAFIKTSVGNRKACCSSFWLLCSSGSCGIGEEGCLCTCPDQKRRYWLKHVLGDNIIAHFTEKKVGKTDAMNGELDSIPFYLYGMKEPDYMMQIMVTYGTLEEKGLEKKGTTLKMEIKR